MQTNFFIAFLAGIISVFSPCILPVIPAYFAYISNQKRSPILHAILFTLGFTVVFFIFGAVVGSLGQFLLTHKRTIEIIGGIIILIFAIQTSGLIKIRALLKERRIQLPKSLSNISPLKSLLAGIVFAFGWSPCYGPVLGSIFTLALSETSATQGILLFTSYSIGMGLTFLILAILATKTSALTGKTGTFAKIFRIIMTLLLIILAIGMLTGDMGYLANSINSLYTKYNLNIF
ncbi:cytochrome c biogenesis protein CcdA [Candidatus Peregrinibacteria bacterium]|jgi:cytochrome c-type biogenesis protein|nr:cytochrome c biogenesis protein CcdA [Candidatus Peregrinibacteria bacterium]MBT4148466.1 cytochrome c biogenesis protein CcdA [Candidatus Peregrinibacteria bacterium]MBT4455544.1 cytochrome c biogenesis protein CcdA [Candidatus Peregrinibacteria bacterium]